MCVSRTCVPHLVMEASLSCNALLAPCLFISTAGFCLVKNVEMCYHHGGCSITLSIHVPAVRSMKCSLALMLVGSAFFFVVQQYMMCACRALLQISLSS